MHWKYIGLRLNEIRKKNILDGRQKSEAGRKTLNNLPPDFGLRSSSFELRAKKFIETKSSCNKIAGF